MNRTRLFVIRGMSILCVTLIITSSSCTFMFNPESIFATFNKPDTEAISYLTGDELLSSLLINRKSKVFYKTLTYPQYQRIVQSLDRIIIDNTQSTSVDIQSDAAYAKRLTQAALSQIDLFINTNILCYAVINNMADVILDIQTFQANPNPANIVYKILFEPVVQALVQQQNEIVAFFFLNMYAISDRYILIAQYGQKDSVSGGDIQTCATAAIFSSIVGIITDIGGNSIADIKTAIELIVETANELNNSDDAGNLEIFLQRLATKIQESGLQFDPNEIKTIFQTQILSRVDSLGRISTLAGYTYLGEGLSTLIKNIGGIQ